ncbi:MAG: hypothetical protein IT260_23655 [Saprospiraceae bacterium]|nr:hypothetical protein [Saprospiraceae bacterium]
MYRPRKYACGLLLLCSIVSTGQRLSAQERGYPDSASAKPYWEAAVDLLWLIDKNTVPASSIFFRRNFPKSDGAHTALRIRLGLETEYETIKGISIDAIPLDSSHSLKPILHLGYELGKTKGRYIYFYGIDLMGSLYSENHNFLITSTPGIFDSTLFKRNIRELNVGGSLFCGFKWKLVKGLSVSVESHLSGIFTRYRYKEESGKYGLKPTGFADDRITRFRVRIRPIQVVNLSYCL